MRLYPAIDLKDGKCVRLLQGNYDQVTVFGHEPGEMAKKWESLGGSFLHLVDLDGAKAGKGINDAAIQAIIKSVSIPVELGGGIRTIEDIEQKLVMGVSRVILGSIAVKDFGLVEEAIQKFGAERIVVGVDAKDGKVAIEGWQEVTALDALDFCQRLEKAGVRTVIYTDIAKDGMMQGPNVQETERLVAHTGLDIVASGGVATLEDLKKVEASGVEGAIIGKAIYTGAIDLAEAVRLFERK
ncbi:MAG: 1-(5-phosphoribosyl)-5-[(5-phosphoribosylamino)methylideneamino]imidazole-4-carboxamide isomerase [Cellulosilyticaceae bacterium]